MLLYLIRHGETVWNHERRTQGWTDIELNANGRRHAAAIGRALRDVPLEAVYASNLSRALATAEAIAAWHSLPLQRDGDLRELHQGELDGLTTEDLRRDHASLLDEWRVSPASVKMPGGESMLELQSRAWRSITRIVEAHPEGTVAVVSHNLAIVTVLCKVLGLELNDFRRLRQDVAAINLLEFHQKLGAMLLRLNDTAHLLSGSRFVRAAGELTDSREFGAAPVLQDDVEQIVGAARGAGLPAGSYRVTQLSPGQARSLAASLQTVEAQENDQRETALALETAAIVLAVVARVRDRYAGERLGAAIQAMRLSALALGYGTAWLDEELCRCGLKTDILDLEPGERLCALLPVGVCRES